MAGQYVTYNSIRGDLFVSRSNGNHCRAPSNIISGVINDTYLPDFNTPFGRFKESGCGRESGKKAIDVYLQFEDY
jgi:acyl-CoA reductase-like NAD-dependent aldehyde dehydrogenase